ncbi:MAG: hypothetical protein JWN73_1765 [Betaproteobacteria bacterium]|nr:hypothetical protein [Betaproteobacteria bacterium]
MPEAPNIVALGARAAAALAQSGGALRLIPGFTETPYRYAGENIVWVGMRGEAHPRAVFVDAPAQQMRLAWDSMHPVPASLHARANLDRAATAQRFAELAHRCRELGEPRGFGQLLVGALPPFPLDRRVDAANALAAAAGADDAETFAEAALRLLGVGGGLTPSGDDFVGAALFTLHHLGIDNARWREAVQALTAATRTRTHAISAALFDDLAGGESFAPLHDLIGAADATAMLEPARRLTAIGHSSGWDMLCGMIAAATGKLQHPLN